MQPPSMSRTLEWLRPRGTSNRTGLDNTDEGATAMEPNQITAILNLPISQEFLARDPLRMAYVAERQHA